MSAEQLAALSIAQVFTLLEASSQAIRSEVAAIPAGLATWHPAPAEWCVHECLGHMIEAERRGFNGRLRLILASAEPALPGWDQRSIAAQRDDCHKATAAIVAELLALRDDSLRLVSSLKDSDLERWGTHPLVGRLRVSDLLHEWVFHDNDHHRQLLKNIQDGLWSHMGNAQGFSQPATS